jgi:GNAT superfamily N-acetyltransferase
MRPAPIVRERRDLARIGEIGNVSIAFTVDRAFEIGPGLALTEVSVRPSWTKDYDRIEGNAPTDWQYQFDIANWGWLTARAGGAAAGSVLIACATPDLELLEGRDDLAAIWDIRVTPGARRTGIGAALIAEAERWAHRRGCRTLSVETQNNNVGACRFYANAGFRLREANPRAYPEFPDEVQMIWNKSLSE